MTGRRLGRVVIVTAGTSDLPVAEEARVTAEAWNCDVSLVADVGVAGLHRLLHQLPHFKNADALVVVAGMEGALPSVVGGLVDCPVIAVPTSIGYGAHFQGVAALLGMLNSCASNVVVVNIDAGFSGGHVASLIARRMGQARQTAAKPTSRPSCDCRRHRAVGSTKPSARFASTREHTVHDARTDRDHPGLPASPARQQQGAVRLRSRRGRLARHGRRRRSLRRRRPSVRGRSGQDRHAQRSPADRRQLRAVVYDLSPALRRKWTDPVRTAQPVLERLIEHRRRRRRRAGTWAVRRYPTACAVSDHVRR